MKIVSWNVNGIRAAIKKGFLNYLNNESPDILCLQEVKAESQQVASFLDDLSDYHVVWNAASSRKGYSGVATFSKEKPYSSKIGLGIPRFDREGRVVVSEFKEFTLFNVYFPNGQKDDERLKFKLDFYDDFLSICNSLRKKGKSIIVCGDFNTAHKKIDLAHPEANEKYSGFLPIERDWMDRWVDHGYVDTFRLFNKNPEFYSWWSYRRHARENNIGWRLDYHFVSSNLLADVKASYIQSEILGSDHCPVVMEIF